MTVDGLYWDEAGRADVGMIEPGDTVYCICRGADGLFSVSSGVCAVSYTHLDVYKRQVRDGWPRRRGQGCGDGRRARLGREDRR